MSEVVLEIPCDTYLRQWITAECGGSTPVRLKKGSPESIFLDVMLRPKSEAPGVIRTDDDPLKVIIPNFRYKSPEIYNYLPPKAQIAFVSLLRRRFDLQLWSDLMQLDTYFERKDHLIAAWMETHGIEDSEKNTLAVTKRIQRLNDRMKAKERMKKSRKSH